MSTSTASAAAALPSPRIRRLPPWTRRRNPYCAVPEVFWTHVAREVSPSALIVLGYLLFAAGEEEFSDLKQEELAKKLKMHGDTVQAALDELDRAGAIAKRKLGKRNLYDLLVDDWRKVKCRPRPKVEEMPAEIAEEESAEPTAEIPRKPLQSLRLKQGEARAINIPAAITCRTVRCENHSTFPLEIEARIGEDSLLQLEISEKANNKRSSDDKSGLSQQIPGHFTGYPQLREMLNRSLGSALGLITENDLRSIGDALGETPMDHLARRIHQRRSLFSGGKGTWGGALLLAREVSHAFAAASSSTPATPSPQIHTTSAEDEAAYNAHCEQLFASWWSNQSPAERDKSTKQRTREVLKLYPGAQLWQPEQLTDAVHRVIRAEALKLIAPTYEEFLRPQAKGAGR